LQESRQSPKQCFNIAINKNLLVVCEDCSISIAFDYSIDYSDPLGATVAVKLIDIVDLGGYLAEKKKIFIPLLFHSSSTLLLPVMVMYIV